MKKIILSIVGLIAILWIAMFVTDTKVLVWEQSPLAVCKAEFDRENEVKKAKGEAQPLWMPEWCGNYPWSCTYFNGRRFIKKSYSYADSCPNLL